MEAIQKRVSKHDLEEINFTVMSGMDSVVKNWFNRLRICVRVICCIPLEHIIPSEIFQKKSDVNRLRQQLSKTRVVRELRFEMLPKSRTSLKNKNRNENPIPNLISKTQILSKSQSSLGDKRSKNFEKKGKSLKCHSILKDRNKYESSEIKPKIDNPISEVPLKKHQLSFQTSENKLQSKKATCRLFKSRSKKKFKMPGNEASDLNKVLRWRGKSSTSGKSSENGLKCKKKPVNVQKKSKKLKVKEKDCVRLKFVCSDSNSPAITSTAKEFVGDGPAKGFNCLNSQLIDYSDDFIMDYFKHGSKEILR